MKKAFWFLFFMLLVTIDSFACIQYLSLIFAPNLPSKQQMNEYLASIIIICIVAYTLCLYSIGITIIIIPQFNISFLNIPLLIVVLIFVKDLFFYISISTLNSFSTLICMILGMFIVNYANIYLLRQLKLILLKDNSHEKTVNYIQYYSVFLAGSIYIYSDLGKFMLNLSENQVILIMLLSLAVMGVLAIGVSKSFFGDYPEIDQEQPGQHQWQCSIFKGNQSIGEIVRNAKVLSQSITKIVPMLLLSSLTYQFCSIQAQKWLAIKGTISQNDAQGFGIVAAAVVFPLFLRRSLKQSAIIIILINILINPLVLIKFSSSLAASILMVLSNFASYLIYIWSYSVVMLIFEGKYEVFGLVFVWINLGQYGVTFLHSIIVQKLKSQIAFGIIYIISNIFLGLYGIILIGQFQRRDFSFEQLILPTQNSLNQSKGEKQLKSKEDECKVRPNEPKKDHLE